MDSKSVLRRKNIQRQAKIEELERELAHWKANHDEQLRKKRSLSAMYDAQHAKLVELKHNVEVLEKAYAQCRDQLAECRENCAELDCAVDALVEERDQYDADLEGCRDERDMLDQAMIDYRAEAEYQERERAAAEARGQAVIRLCVPPEWVGGDDGEGPRWCPECRMLEPDGHTSDCVHTVLEAWRCDRHATLDAALEQAYQKGWDERPCPFYIAGVKKEHAKNHSECFYQPGEYAHCEGDVDNCNLSAYARKRHDVALEEARADRDLDWFNHLVEYLDIDISMDCVQFPMKTVEAGIDVALEQARDEGYKRGQDEASCEWAASDGRRNGYRLGVAEEREQCARRAMATFNPKQPEDADYDWGYNDAKRDIAHAIRNQEDE